MRGTNHPFVYDFTKTGKLRGILIPSLKLKVSVYIDKFQLHAVCMPNLIEAAHQAVEAAISEEIARAKAEPPSKAIDWRKLKREGKFKHHI